jgi:hypothetical protein
MSRWGSFRSDANLDEVMSGRASSPLPGGVIVMWYGLLTDIPAGWALCVTGDTLVTLADGSLRRIDAIVEGRQAVEVLSFNSWVGAGGRSRVS